MFDGYLDPRRPHADAYDEMFDPVDGVRTAYKRLHDSLTPLQPGDRAPDLTVPAATREGLIALADYHGRSPILLALLRGLY